MKRGLYSLLGFTFCLLGCIYIINSISNTTGFAVIEEVNKPVSSLIGLGSLAIGFFFLSLTRKKGQVAMELTMTYGWAIIAVIGIISVLAMSGAIEPTKYAQGSVILSPPFYASAWNVKQDSDPSLSGDQSAVILELKNNGDETYSIENIYISNCGSSDSSMQIEPKSPIKIAIECVYPLKNGKLFKGDISITYKKHNSQIDLTSTGAITEKVVSV